MMKVIHDVTRILTGVTYDLRIRVTVVCNIKRRKRETLILDLLQLHYTDVHSIWEQV